MSAVTMAMRDLIEQNNRLAAEVEALKQLWFSDADPAETRYASEFAAMKEQT